MYTVTIPVMMRENFPVEETLSELKRAKCDRVLVSSNRFFKETPDGLRIDALSNIIYWHGNKARGVNNNAVAYIKHMNGQLKKQFPDIMLIAEDSTSYPGVT